MKIGALRAGLVKAVVALNLVIGAAATANAQNGTWTNLAGGSWPTTTNWAAGIVANGTDSTANFSTLNITANATVTLDGPRTIGNMSFADATTASNNWILSTGSSGPLTLDTTVGIPTITVTNQTATINAVVAGSDGLTKAGAGILVLTGVNTYSNGTTITAGQLHANNNSALGTGAVTINGLTGRLFLGSGVTINNNLTFGATVDPGSGLGALQGPTTGSATYSGAINFTTSTLQGGHIGGATTAGQNLILSGALTAAVPITLRNGNIRLDNAVGNSYAALRINEGTTTLGVANAIVTTATLSIADVGGGTAVFNMNNFNQTVAGLNLGVTTGGASATGTINMGTGVLTLNGNVTSFGDAAHVINGNLDLGGVVRTFTIANGNQGNDLTIAAVISNGSLTMSGAGTMHLTGANTYTGATLVNDGVLSIGTPGSISNSTSITVGAGGGTDTLRFDGAGTYNLIPITLSTAGNTGALNLRQGTINISTVTDGGGTSRIDMHGGAGATVSVGGGAGALNIDILDWDNGTLTVGTLTVGTEYQVRNTTLAINGAATLNLGGGGNAFVFDAGGNGTAVVNRNVDLLAGTRTFNIGNGTAQFDTNIAGVISNGSLTKSGTGALQLSNANTYAGTTSVSAGVLVLNNANALPGGVGATLGTSALTLSGGGIIGLTAATPSFQRGLGTGVTQVQWTGSGGFAAYGGARTVNLGGASAVVTWGTGNFVPSGSNLVLGDGSADNTVDFQNPINLNAGARTIQVDNGSAAVDGLLSGAVTNGSITKTGLGTLALSNAGNTYSNLAVSAGAVESRHSGALGGGVSLTNNTSLVFNGAVAGDFTAPVSSSVSLSGNVSISNASAVAPVTLTGPITVSNNAAIGFSGVGDIVLTQAFGNGATAAQNGLTALRFSNGSSTALINFGNTDFTAGPNSTITAATGLLSQTPVLAGTETGPITYTGTWTGLFGPNAVNTPDNFQVVWTGDFTPTQTGSYTFGIRRAAAATGDIDDEGSFYVDINQNGIFEASEGIANGNSADFITPSLTASQKYQVAIGFSDATGGENFSAVGFNGPVGSAFAGATNVVINPSTATHGFSFNPDVSVTKTGTGTTTLAGANTYDSTTTISQGTLVAANGSGSNTSGALGISDGTAATGTRVANGATLGIGGPAAGGPVSIGNEHLTLAPTATIRNMGGVNSIASASIVPDASVKAVAGNSISVHSGTAAANQLSLGTVGGSMNLGFSALTAAGVGETTIESNITAQAINTTVTSNVNGLNAARYTGAKPATDLTFSSAGAPAGTYSFNAATGQITQTTLLLNNVPAQTGLQNLVMNFDDDSGLTSKATINPGNTTNIHYSAIFGAAAAGDQSDFQLAWTGEFTPDANTTYTFRSHNNNFTGDPDDDASLYIDVNNDGVFQASEGFSLGTTGTVTTPALSTLNKYKIAIGFREGSGDDNFSFSFQGGAGSAFTALTGINPGAANQNGMFTSRTTESSPTTYHLVKNDDGILRLNGLLNYDGATQVNDGTIIVNNLLNTTPQGNWEINSNTGLGQQGILGGDGVIVLKPGASVIVSATPGVISPGDGGPGYNNPLNPAGQFSTTFSQGTDTTTVGTLSVNAATNTDIAIDLNGILQIDIVDADTYDVLQAINGQIDLDPSTSILNINGADTAAEWAALNFSLMGFASGDLLDIVVAQDGFVSGSNFSNLASDVTFMEAGGQFLVTIGQDNDSIFISIEAVPEPATIALWSTLGLVGVAFAWRQRRKVRR